MAKTSGLGELNLVGCLFIVAIALPRFLDQTNYGLQQRISHLEAGVEAAMKDDPPIGEQLPIPGRASELGYLILVTDTCSGCSIGRIQSLAIFPSEDGIQKVVLAPSAVLSQIREQLRAYEKQIDFIAIEEVDAKKLNCVFYPRVYAIDPHGRLAYIQGPKSVSDQALWSGQKELEEASHEGK